MHDVPVIDGGEKDVEIDSRELFLQFGYSPLQVNSTYKAGYRVLELREEEREKGLKKTGGI